MQSQFTDKAQNALAQAGRCARGLKQGYIGTEHILVGLLKEDTGVAAKVLTDPKSFAFLLYCSVIQCFPETLF